METYIYITQTFLSGKNCELFILQTFFICKLAMVYIPSLLFEALQKMGGGMTKKCDHAPFKTKR